jgi:hypothetical protein
MTPTDHEEEAMKRTSRTRVFLTRTVAIALLGALAVAMAGCSALSGSRSSQPLPASQSASRMSYDTAAKGELAAGPPAPPAARGGGGGGARGGPAAAPVPTPGQASTVAKAEQMIIRNGNMRIEVTKVSETADKLRALAKKYGGVIANLEVSTEAGSVAPQPLSSDRGVSNLSSGQPYNGSVTILVPSSKFDAVTDEVRGLGKVLTYRTDDQNVTEQHIDMKARLDNMKAQEARLRAFFDSAKNVGEMLSVERELARVRGDIESLTAQLAHLERQAAMATLVVELTEPKALVRPQGVDWGIGTAFTEGVQGFAEVLGFLIRFILAILPLAFLVTAIVLFIRWRVRKSRDARIAPPAPPAAGPGSDEGASVSATWIDGSAEAVWPRRSPAFPRLEPSPARLTP